MTKDQLIQHALQALKGCLSGDEELTVDNASVGIVGEHQEFVVIEGEKLKPYLDAMEVAAIGAEDMKMSD